MLNMHFLGEGIATLRAAVYWISWYLPKWFRLNDH